MTPKNILTQVEVVRGRGRVIAAWKADERGGFSDPELLDVLVDPDHPYTHHEPVAAFTVVPIADGLPA